MQKIVFVLSLLLAVSQAQIICNKYCDGRDPSQISEGSRKGDVATISGREITITISDEDNMAYATISNGSPGDEVWIDRSFDGGLNWGDGSLLGFTSIPEGRQETNTFMFNIDNDGEKIRNGLGAVRACGRGLNPSPLACTQWVRSKVKAETPIAAAATALMQYYNGKLFNVVGWWNGANAITAIVQYMKLTDTKDHLYVIDQTFKSNLDEWFGNYTSDALDDTEWWAMAWIDAFDVTNDQKYLDMARFLSDYIHEYVDDVCGGGVWWSIARTYKNAITNELLIQITASIHNRIQSRFPGDTKYLEQSKSLWNWFKQSGMINGESLINDGLRDDCSSNRDTTWTYNQGVILGGLVELFKATNDETYLTEARKIADAVINSPVLTKNGILTEPCEGTGHADCGNWNGGCDCNAITFKGVFMRNIGELNRNLQGRPYQSYIVRQRDSNYEFNRNLLDQYGVHYAGPLEDVSAATIQSSLEAFTAAL